MSSSLPIAALAALLLAASACSSTPPPDQPSGSSTSSTEGEGSPDPGQGSGETEVKDEPTTAPMGTVNRETKDNSIPDDYTMLRGDCTMLGQKLRDVTRADYMVQLSPKLSDDKRAKAEENINDVATKLGDQWTRTCMESLVDKVVERERIKCAMESRTAKAFEECINPPQPK